MVIKTDELPAAAPADSAREHGSQAGGKGRPNAAGEWAGARGSGAGAEPSRRTRDSAAIAAFPPRQCGRYTGPPPL